MKQTNNPCLPAIEIDKFHDRFLTVKNGRGTCQLHLRVTQLAAGSSFLSQVTFEVFISCTFCREILVTRDGRARVIGRSLIGRKASQLSRRSVASASRQSGCGRGSGARIYADRLTNGVRGSRARKSVVVRSQVTRITWPIIHFLFTRMSVAPQNRCKR